MNESLRILYLEDDRNDVELVGAVLTRMGLAYAIDHVDDRKSYLLALEKRCHDIIIIDFKLPAFEGISALKIAREKCMNVPAIVLSGSLSEEMAAEIIKEGATDYVLKDRIMRLPFSIGRALREQLEIIELKKKEKKLLQSKDAFLNMLKETDFAYKELKKLHESLVEAFANIIDAKSPWTKGHSSRVARYAREIAKVMGLKGKDIDSLNIAGLLHDIGKIGTYDVILDKADRLTHEEFEIVKKHPAHGESILSPIKQLQHILPLIRHHHERIDGKGYPDGLKGEEIPLGARILHVADSYDSMTADRPYRPAPGKDYAVSEFKKYSGVQFDAEVIGVFLSILN